MPRGPARRIVVVLVRLSVPALRAFTFARYWLLVIAATLIQPAVSPPSTIIEAQATTEREGFDVVSIREHVSDSTARTTIRQQPSGLTATNATAVDLIAFAFDVIERQVVGELPSWVKATRFDVVARTANGPLTRVRLRAMTRALLEDRFRLEASNERSEGPVYALVVTRSSLPPFDGTTVGIRPSQSKCVVDPPLRDALAPPTQAQNISPCGFTVGIGGALTGLFGSRVTMQQLAGQLLRIGGFDRPVVDRTGLNGAFDLAAAPTPDMVAPTTEARFLIAMREQLGLTLRAEQGSFEIVRVRRIERPSPN